MDEPWVLLAAYAQRLVGQHYVHRHTAYTIEAASVHPGKSIDITARRRHHDATTVISWRQDHYLTSWCLLPPGLRSLVLRWYHREVLRRLLVLPPDLRRYLLAAY